MGTNPNPSRITDASWRYIEARLAMDPGDAIYAGSYVNKPGYHGTRAENQARDRVDGSADYSVRLPADLLGPADKTAGYDIKFASAAAGNFGPMARRGAHVLAAFEARDPRLFGWREWLGQTDLDRAAEGLDFTTWTKRVPDDTHEWHDHESELREHVGSWDNKACMLSVAAGETLSAYLARGGQLITGGTVMPDPNYGTWPTPPVPGNRTGDLMTAELWMGEKYGMGAYGTPAKPDKSARQLQLDRIEELLKAVPTAEQIAAAVIKLLPPGAGGSAPTAQEIADAVADEQADRLQN